MFAELLKVQTDITKLNKSTIQNKVNFYEKQKD